MSRIYNTTTGEVHEVTLIDWDGGTEFLNDVIGGCSKSDEWLAGIPEDRDDVDYAMNDEEVEWWTLWASREQRINDIYREADDETQDLIALTYSDNDWDMWLAQDRTFEALGIEG